MFESIPKIFSWNNIRLLKSLVWLRSRVSRNSTFPKLVFSKTKFSTFVKSSTSDKSVVSPSKSSGKIGILHDCSKASGIGDSLQLFWSMYCFCCLLFVHCDHDSSNT